MAHRERTLLLTLRNLTAAGTFPTTQELADLSEIGQTWTHKLLDALEEKGYIMRTKQWRSLRVTTKGKNALKRKA